MADDRFYAVAEAKPRGVAKDDFDQAQEKLAAKANGEEYKAPDPAKAEVVATDRPAADSDTIAESQKAEPEAPKAKAPAKK